MSTAENANLAPTWTKSDDHGEKVQVTSHGEGQASHRAIHRATPVRHSGGLACARHCARYTIHRRMRTGLTSNSRNGVPAPSAALVLPGLSPRGL